MEPIHSADFDLLYFDELFEMTKDDFYNMTDNEQDKLIDEIFECTNRCYKLVESMIPLVENLLTLRRSIGFRDSDGENYEMLITLKNLLNSIQIAFMNLLNSIQIASMDFLNSIQSDFNPRVQSTQSIDFSISTEPYLRVVEQKWHLFSLFLNENEQGLNKECEMLVDGAESAVFLYNDRKENLMKVCILKVHIHLQRK